MSITTNPLGSVVTNAMVKRDSRLTFARLSDYQRRALRSEYHFLREVHRMAPFAAAGIIRRMASMATWG